MTAPYRPRDPLVIGAYLWPVYGFSHDARKETVATMFFRDAAEAMVTRSDTMGFEKRNLYVGPARKDARV